MWAMLIPLISSILGENGPLGQYFKTKADTVKAKAEYDLEVEKMRKEYAIEMAKAAVTQQANQLNATGQWFKFITFCMVSLPILITCFFPEFGKRIFDNLAGVPIGWFQLWAAIVGVIWGFPIAANAMSVIFDSINKGWSVRNAGKIDMVQAKGEANTVTTEQAIKLAYDVQRKLSPTGMLSQQQVDTARPLIQQALDLAQSAVQSNSNAPIVQSAVPGGVTLNTGEIK